MCPAWTRVADEIDSLARDRVLAASVEPEPAEHALLIREALLLRAAAECARSGPRDGQMVHTACEGVVVHCGHMVMWGISEEGEQALRALARDPAVGVDSLVPCRVLGALLGVPEDGALLPAGP